jgi:teichuronic acid biosynthesis glycosyltransferase TuaC
LGRLANTVKTLLFSTLYPSSARPLHGVFVETRLRELLSLGGVSTKVVAPVPWFPSTDPRHGNYAAMAATPQREVHNGVDVLHPRYVVVPKIGMNVTPFFLAFSARAALKALQREGFDFDLIDAHYYYPDGVAAALLGAWFNKPVVITARGTDVNLIPEYTIPRALIRWASRQAQASIGVSVALTERMHNLGMAAERLHVMRNGVDTQRFQLLPQHEARASLGMPPGPVILTVGNLHEHKGQRLALDAFAQLHQQEPAARLYIVGEGPDRNELQQQAQALGLVDAVTLVGTVPNTELARWYSAADVLVLASSREGWPNVLLEAMACGTPVVATRVGGVPEIVQTPQSGRVVPERTAAAFAAAIRDLLDQRAPDAAQRSIQRAAVREYAQGFGWDRTSQDQLQLFNTLAFKTPVAHT